MAQDVGKKPGIYYDVPYEEYRRFKGANNSLLSILSEDTPAHVKWAMDNDGDETSRPKEIGLLVHKMILERHRLPTEIAIQPEEIKQRRGARWEAFEAENANRLILRQKDWDTALAMTKRLLAHDTVAEVFANPGHNEVSLVWDAPLGPAGEVVRSKVRTDRLGTLGDAVVFLELKTLDSANRRKFENQINNLCYHTAAAHALDAGRVLMPTDAERKFLFAVIESRPPYEPAVYELEEGALEIADSERLKWLAVWGRCIKEGKWPGYDPGVGTVGLPTWKYRAFDSTQS